MPTPFPGMDPHLERPGLWEDVQTRLIVAIADALWPSSSAALLYQCRTSRLSGSGDAGRSLMGVPF
jgi:hypothetical protein